MRGAAPFGAGLPRDDIFGRLLAGSGQAGVTIASRNDAILFVEIQPEQSPPAGGFRLSTYGLGEQLAEVRDQFTITYRLALDLPE